jgi:hypothetical protein
VDHTTFYGGPSKTPLPTGISFYYVDHTHLCTAAGVSRARNRFSFDVAHTALFLKSRPPRLQPAHTQPTLKKATGPPRRWAPQHACMGRRTPGIRAPDAAVQRRSGAVVKASAMIAITLTGRGCAGRAFKRQQSPPGPPAESWATTWTILRIGGHYGTHPRSSPAI